MQAAQCGPDSLVGSVLAKWCDESFPGLPATELPSIAELKHTPAVCEFVDFLKNEDLLGATYWLSSAYAQLAGEGKRRQLAMFFTPPSLTRRLLDDLSVAGIDFATNSFCDPACGGAAFLVPVAMRMRDALLRKGASAPQILGHVQKHLLGVEKDAALCALSRHFLMMALYEEVVATRARPKFRLYLGDSLQQSEGLLGKIGVVVCNPPFRKLRALEVNKYFAEFEDVIAAQPNLYTLFIALCVRLLAPGGTCALLTPTSFLSGQYFSKLRTFLLKHTKVLSLGMVDDRLSVFIDVEQETALTLMRRTEVRRAPSARATVSVISRDGGSVHVGKCFLPNSGAAWPIPRTENDVALIKVAQQSQARLTDYGYAARIGAFVWNRDTRPTYASARSAAYARNDSAVPLLWASDIAPDGSLRFTGAPKANKEPCFVNLGAKDHSGVVRRPSVLLQRVTSNSQPRRLVAAAVPRNLFQLYGGFVGENHTVILEQTTPAPALTPRQLAQLLATPTVDRYFRCISGVTNVSVFELNQLRLPDPHLLKEYLARGHDMASAARKALEAHP